MIATTEDDEDHRGGRRSRSLHLIRAHFAHARRLNGTELDAGDGPSPPAPAATCGRGNHLPTLETCLRGTMRDLYAVLELDPEATAAEMRRAYLTLLRRLHPDTRETAPGSEAAAAAADLALHEVQSAYEVLGDPARRTAYDRANLRSPATTAGPEPTTVPVRQRRSDDDVPIRAGPVRWQPVFPRRSTG